MVRITGLLADVSADLPALASAQLSLGGYEPSRFKAAGFGKKHLTEGDDFWPLPPNVYSRNKKPVPSSQIPAPAAPLPEFMDVEEVLERMKEIGKKYPDLSGTFSEMQEKYLQRTKLREATPGALSDAKNSVEIYQSRMDELNALAPVDEELEKLFTELKKKEKFDNSFSTKKRKTINRGILSKSALFA